MDPVAFDRRFSRFVSQVDAGEMRGGVVLYEKGDVTLRNVGSKQIEGSVIDGKQGVFRARLLENDEGGFSGSCDCERFFNCRHCYALARAARDQIVGRFGASTIGAKPARREESDTASQLASRLGQAAPDARTRKLAEALDRVFQLAKSSGWLVYPKDLHAMTADGKRPNLPGNEPLRELKRLLGPDGAASPIALLDALAPVCARKGISLDATLGRVANADDGKPRVSESALEAAKPRWDDKPLRLAYRVRLERTSDQDWFQARAELEVEGGGYSNEELRALLAANGQLAQLPGKGWRRLELDPNDPALLALQAAGIDPQRGNTQRLHAGQLAELIPESLRDGDLWTGALARGRDLASLPLPHPPASLASKLRPYQLDGFHFLCRLTQWGLGGLLADDMGLGKTLQALTWLVWQRDQRSPSESFRVLVVCPKSVVDNWVHEPAKFGTGLMAVAFRPELLDTEILADATIVVANYTQLRLQSEFFLGQDWDVAILDEGQYIKSPEAQTTQVAYALKARQRIILSGTPIENRLLDLWSLMRFAMPRLLGPQATFAANYSTASNPKALDALRRRIQPFMLRRLKSQVAQDLPARIEEEIHCELEKAQSDLYEEELALARAALRAAKRGEGSTFNALQSLLRLRQICCDPSLLDGEWSADEKPAKVQALLDLLEPLVAEGHKVLVFSQFVSMLERLKPELDRIGIASLSLTGKTRDRKSLIDQFQSPAGEPVFLLSLKAAGSGLNLTAASYVVLFDPWWNPAVEAQAIDRTHRIGQRNQVIAYRLIAKNTVEEKIRALQAEKAALANAVSPESGFSESLSLGDLDRILGD